MEEFSKRIAEAATMYLILPLVLNEVISIISQQSTGSYLTLWLFSFSNVNQMAQASCFDFLDGIKITKLFTYSLTNTVLNRKQSVKFKYNINFIFVLSSQPSFVFELLDVKHDNKEINRQAGVSMPEKSYC